MIEHTEGRKHPMRIGVLDDSSVICHLLKTSLSLKGHQIDTFIDPTSFLDHAAFFDCILVDFHLPGGWSGAEIIRHVRRGHPLLPAVLMSAGIIPEAALHDLEPVALLCKPFSLSTLFTALTAALGEPGDHAKDSH